MSTIIKTEKLVYTYEGADEPTLRGLDLEIEEGSFVAVLGHNGSGKSTLAKHMNGILIPTSGRVLVDGMDTAEEENLHNILAETVITAAGDTAAFGVIKEK